jgi:hypothetical protein
MLSSDVLVWRVQRGQELRDFGDFRGMQEKAIINLSFFEDLNGVSCIATSADQL